MSRVVRVAGRMIELSGLHGVWLGIRHPIGSRITLFYPNGPTQTIDYKHDEWEQAEMDRNAIQDALRPGNAKDARKDPLLNLTVRKSLE